MKNKLSIFLFLLIQCSIHAQRAARVDSLKSIINQHNADTAEVNALAQLAFEQEQFDSAIKYATQGVSLAKKINYKPGEANSYWILARVSSRQSNFSQAIKYSLNALKIYETLKDHIGSASVQLMLQGIYREARDYKKALSHALTGYRQIMAANSNAKATIGFPGHRFVPLFLAEIAQTYLLDNQLDSALIYTRRAISENEIFEGARWNFPIYLLATIQTIQGHYNSALENYRLAIPLAIQNDFFRDTLQIYSGMSTLFKKMEQYDSAIHYAQMVVDSKNSELETKNLLEAVTNLGQAYKLRGNNDSAFKYIEFSHNLRDSIYTKEKDRELQNIAFNEQLKQQEILSAQARYKSKIQLYAFAAGFCVLILISVLLWRNNRRKQKAKVEIEKAYADLKSTQSQLIQSEKMASLGEMTAGIAHEIQNPLNFVNNFSEVNDELLKELKTEAEKGNMEGVKAIANDIAFNSEKINHHGKRADSIVKGMLQHSRTSSGQKEPTDINALADEYLRLAYHGHRAKDKSFNATTRTEFDNSIGKINVNPQDMGRVILNLINNAFYAVNEKTKQNLNGYEPAVIVSTKTVKPPLGGLGAKIEIKIKDNGNGIPQKILDKIFQPFFTTKPTGQGTGLGLSLAYDIITKGHGGELKVETKEGEGSVFNILLPV